MKFKKIIFAGSLFVILSQMMLAESQELYCLKSPDGLNVISVLLKEGGRPFYRVTRKDRIIIGDSPLGLRCDQKDFSREMALHQAVPEKLYHERYQLLTGNKLTVDSVLNCRQIILKNASGTFLTIDLVASNEGVGFRYCIQDEKIKLHTVVEEMTGFQVPLTSTGWLEPYHAAGKYTPAYEDFYFQVSSGEMPPISRERPRGWCLPGLFHIPSAQSWILIAESGTDASYCACHLVVAQAAKDKMYKIEFAFEDEVTAGKTFAVDAKPLPVTTNITPWRIIIVGDEANDILESTLVTDLAPPSRIEDTSWIKPGRASWSWWSHPEAKDTAELYNSFTDLAVSFGWEYTLFDAGWWNVDLDAICQYASVKGVKPLIWMHAADFYDAHKRRRKLDEMVGRGIGGIKVDFWCSDRQEAMAAIEATLKDAADRKLVVGLHGCTIPRGWHRTWPNLLTAEAVLGTECYFYEARYPEKVAELNTILPFTRNVLAPMDTTPVALTMRKFPRKTTAVHELAASIIFNSGIIHYADSVDVLSGFPQEVKQVLRNAPAAWDETVCLRGNPGKEIVLARRTNEQWVIAGLNGMDKPQLISLNLGRFSHLEGFEITEGQDPLMDFSILKMKDISIWKPCMPPFGGFVLHLGPKQ